MKQVVRFLQRYKLFGLACYSLLAGLVLQALGQKTASHWLLGVVSILAILPLSWDMVQDVRAGKYGINLLAITAISGSVWLAQYWAAIALVLMLTGNESLENFARRRANGELKVLLAGAPQKAIVLRKGKTVEVAASELKAGDKIVVKSSELVPTDAIIIEGTASFDESVLTGEGLLATKTIGDRLLGGSLNKGADLTAKVSASVADSQYQQIITFVRRTAKVQAPFIRLAARYSLPFTFTAYSIAVAVWVVSGHPIRALEVLIVATPYPLLIAAPLAFMGGMARASRFGIVFNNGGAFENLAEAETIAFGKTGTLTRGELSVEKVLTFHGATHEEVIKLAGSLEQSSNHAVALAIIAYAKANNLKLAKAKHVRELSSQGLQAVVQGQEVIVGRWSLLEERGMSLPKTFKPSSLQQTTVYIACGGEVVGVIALSDEVRDEATATLKRLRSLGLRESLLITGDNHHVATAVAKQLDITHVHAETLPADKLRALDDVKKRPLIFVGYGNNDIPMLTAAEVGIALGGQGRESAGIIILPEDVGRVASAYAIARRTFKIARQSILAGVSLSIVLMLIFATGKFPPLAGAILQAVIGVVVVFNALRAHVTPRT